MSPFLQVETRVFYPFLDSFYHLPIHYNHEKTCEIQYSKNQESRNQDTPVIMEACPYSIEDRADLKRAQRTLHAYTSTCTIDRGAILVVQTGSIIIACESFFGGAT